MRTGVANSVLARSDPLLFILEKTLHSVLKRLLTLRGLILDRVKSDYTAKNL